ncbi:MAG TPA: hypothetical protein ENJ95_05020 [Bacteroidetes bacterium]|nr:hypothetical protein [Bacteroidota bacterium]
MPENKQGEYGKLYQKLKSEIITEKEHGQLLKMTEQQEANAVERLRALAELSQLRKITLDDTEP